jgi:TrmH family RNA methyltransferase
MKNNIQIIQSPSNPKVKAIVKLRQRSVRDDEGLMLIDGIREIALAFKNHIQLKEIYYCPQLFKSEQGKILLEGLKQANLCFYEVSSHVFSKLAFGDRREGLLAVAQQSGKHLEELEVSGDSMFVVVEAIEKPGNLGAIMRTCDAAGVAALIVCDAKTDVYNPNVIRASLGTCFSLSVIETTTVCACAWLKDKKVKILSATPDAQREYWDIDFSFPCALVLGSEDKGLNKTLKAASDVLVHIPMKGAADSLNVSTSTAIILYEALRQQRQMRPKLTERKRT